MLYFVLLLVVAVLIAAATSTRNKRPPRGGQRLRRRSETRRPDTGFVAAFHREAPLGNQSNTPEPVGTIEWLGRGKRLVVHGFTINDPLTYSGTGRARDDGYSRAMDPSQIDASLEITRTTSAPEMGYWPWYEAIEPHHRFIYLTWMASDRRSLPPTDGYLFLYYYGLERRVLVDDADQALVFAEVFRLRKMHAALSRTTSRSFQNYSTSFLWHLIAKYGHLVSKEALKKVVESTGIWTEDAIAIALAWFAARAEPLPDWMAYAVADRCTLSQHSVVIQRAESQFKELFFKKYRTKNHEGIKLRPSKRETVLTYRPASAALTVQSVRVPNVLGMNECNQQLASIWNECVDELRRFSSIIHKEQSTGPLSAEAWEAMPADLRGTIEHPLAVPIHKLISKQDAGEGEVMLTVGELASLAGVVRAEKLSATQSRKLATTLGFVNYAIEPDARHTGKSYRWDERLVVFPLAYSGEPTQERYGAAACILRLGLAIAEADGRIDEEELRRIMEQIETGFQLNDHERRRIEALKALLLTTGSDVSSLGKKLQATLPDDKRQEVGRLLVAVAGIDGILTRGELTALRKCYRALGLPPQSLESAIAELAPHSSDAPVVVQQGRGRCPGEAIPAPPPGEGVVLDRARVMQIMNETREVSLMLAEAMSQEEYDEPVSIAAPAEGARSEQPVSVSTEIMSVQPIVDTASSDNNVPSRYAAFFVALVAQPQWSRSDADALARSHRHMLAGALEAINEWAVEKAGVPLIHDDDSQIHIDPNILNEVYSR